MVFKKDLTPLTRKGSVVKHSGKGSAERRPDVLPQITGRYPKPAPSAPPDEPISPLAPPSSMPEQMALPLDDGT